MLLTDLELQKNVCCLVESSFYLEMLQKLLSQKLIAKCWKLQAYLLTSMFFWLVHVNSDDWKTQVILWGLGKTFLFNEAFTPSRYNIHQYVAKVEPWLCISHSCDNLHFTMNGCGLTNLPWRRCIKPLLYMVQKCMRPVRNERPVEHFIGTLHVKTLWIGMAAGMWLNHDAITLLTRVRCLT